VSNELVIDVTSQEISIALQEEKKLVELTKEKSNLQFSVGDVYLGKVRKIMPGLNAAFVDVGYEKDAFLHYLDLGAQFQSMNKFLNLLRSKRGKLIALPKFRTEPDIPKDGKISKVLKSGQHILVQIAKEPISMKGPRLTSEISIAGRNLVLIPFSDKVSVSQKIESDEERNRLKKLLLSIKPKNYGVIVRTMAEGKRVALLDQELRSLIQKWDDASNAIKNATPPKLVISELNRTSAFLRDILNVNFNNIHVNDRSLHREIKEYIETIAPEKVKIVKYYEGKAPIFEHFGINKQVKQLFGRTVSFKNGSYLIIEHTEALHVIDVNSGNRSKSGDDQETNALEVNVAAAQEIARQLRLRDMGGIIVVDFIDMVTSENKHLLYEKFKEAMSKDRAKHNILPLSKFGLIQITRQRVRPELHIETNESCPTCKGTGKIGPSILLEDEIEGAIRNILEVHKFKSITLQLHPYIYAYLTRGVFSIIRKWGIKYRIRIQTQSLSSLNFLEYHILDPYGDEIIEEELSDTRPE
jgi:ribonuclease G